MPERIEFYVVPMSTARSDTWLVCMATLSRCVGVYASADDALAHAIIKAQYQISGGAQACVRMWSKERLRWHSVWPAEEAVSPR